MYAAATALLFLLGLCSCSVLSETSKYKFNDGLYRKHPFSGKQVYVYKADDDTIYVFPVLEFKDSTAIQNKPQGIYTSRQAKLKDNKDHHTFYKPSFDFDVMTIPLMYRPPEEGFPNQLVTNFNGALYLGYRTDAYHIIYKRTPLNYYKQTVKHFGYSAGVFAGVGSTLVNGWMLEGMQNSDIEYEGVNLITGIAGNVAMQNITFGISLGLSHLLDQYHSEWIYEGKPCIGFTLGLNLN